MPTYVIYHASSRVVRGFTTDGQTPLAEEEILEELPRPYTGSGYVVYKRDGTFREALDEEVHRFHLDAAHHPDSRLRR